MDKEDKIWHGITVLIMICSLVVIFPLDKKLGYKSYNYNTCVEVTHNINGCEKEVYPERFKKRQEKEAYYRKRVPVLE